MPNILNIEPVFAEEFYGTTVNNYKQFSYKWLNNVKIEVETLKLLLLNDKIK